MGAVAVGVAIGAVVGGASAAIQSGGDFNAIWKGALVGAVAGGAGGAIAGWAAPALAPALGSYAGAAAGALGGAAAGVIGGVGNVALNGGTGDDYLKAGLFGGLGGAVVGGISGGISGLGGESATSVNPVTGEAVPVNATPAAVSGESGLAGNDLATGGFMGSEAPATGLSSDVAGGGTQAVQNTVTGTPAPQTAPALSDMYAAAPSTTMTDIGGSSPIPQQLPGGVPIGDSSYLNSGTDLSGFKFSPEGVNLSSSGSTETLSPFQKSLGQDTNFLSSGSDFTNAGATNANVGSDWSMPGAGGTDSLAKAYGFTPQTPGAGYTGAGMNVSKGFSNPPFDFGDFLGQTGKGLAGKMLTAGNMLKGAGSVAGYGEAKQNKQQLMDLYNQQNAYNQQLQGQNAQAFNQNLAANTANQQSFRDQLAAAQGYNTQLQNTYTNPDEYLNSPEAQATRNLAMQKLLAQQSAAGRRTSGLAAQNQLMANQLQNLQAYRTGLRQAIQYPGQVAGMGYQGVDAATNAKILAAAQSQSPTGNALAGLGSIFAPQPNYVVLG